MGRKPKLDRPLSSYLKYGALITPLGKTLEEHFSALTMRKSGIELQAEKGFENGNLYLSKFKNIPVDRYNFILKELCKSICVSFSKEFLASNTTGIILSTTKANLDDLAEDSFASSRQILMDFFCNKNEPIIISNACISGVLAINQAVELLEIGKFNDVLVIGIDVLSDFVVNGFQSLRALSNEPCKPFDTDRKGVSLGEAGAAIVVTKNRDHDFCVEYLGGASSNDANHISGPSRTGEGLVRAVEKTLQRANFSTENIDFISAHGTATPYNDEMEAIGFNRLALQNVPVNSFKGYFGHTLGAAGVLEVLLCLLTIEKKTLFESLGYSNFGLTVPVNVVNQTKKADVKVVLKTASGFGGGNAALLLKEVL